MDNNSDNSQVKFVFLTGYRAGSCFDLIKETSEYENIQIIYQPFVLKEKSLEIPLAIESTIEDFKEIERMLQCLIELERGKKGCPTKIEIKRENCPSFIGFCVGLSTKYNYLYKHEKNTITLIFRLL